MKDNAFARILEIEYARLEAARPRHKSSLALMEDHEMLPIWEFLEHQELLNELSYELNTDEYLSQNDGILQHIRDCLIKDPDAAESYFDYVWDAYYDEGFSCSALDIITESSKAWLDEQDA